MILLFMLILPLALWFGAIFLGCLFGGIAVGVDSLVKKESPQVKATREEREHQEWRKRVGVPDFDPFD